MSPSSARRRAVVALFVTAAAAGAGAAALAQAVKSKRIVVLSAGSKGTDDHSGFVEELRRLGWAEGRNITYEYLYAGGSRDRMVEFARIAAAKKPDLIYAPTAFAAVSATHATRTIPVIFASVTDPTVNGLAVSLARPGGNATGTFQIQADLSAKRLELLREALPRAQRIGVLLDARGADYAQQKQRHIDAGKKAGLEVAVADFVTFDDVPAAMARLKAGRADVVIPGSSFTLISRRHEFIELARLSGMPIVAHRLDWAQAGALLTYGADLHDTLRRTAEIAHQVLNGADPAQSPVQQATKFELVLNLASARKLGIAFPKSLISRADRVID